VSADWLIVLVGLSALFAARAFLPAVIAGLAMRFPEKLPFLDVEIPGDLTQWITSDTGLTILAVLTVLEILAARSPEIQEFLGTVDMWLKMAVAALVNLQIVRSEPGRILFGVEGASPLVMATALASAGPVAAFSLVRRPTLRILRDFDPENDMGVYSLTSWLENFWVIFGVVLLIAVPLVALGMIVLGIALVAALEFWLRAREEKRKIDCPGCGVRAHPFALGCPSCRRPFAHPVRVGVLGQARARLVEDRALHETELLGARRCPRCGERIRERRLPQSCPTCELEVAASTGDLARYRAMMQDRFGRVFVVTLIAGLVPLLGAVFSLIYVRVALVRPWRQYLSRGRSFVLRWLVRLVLFVLVVLSIVPALGLLICPLIAVISFHVWKGGFERAYARALALQPPTAPAAAASPPPAG
jgi:hypothetical protein